MDAEPDPYKVLGVRHDATRAEIRAKYVKLLRAFHPDKHAAGPEDADISAYRNRMVAEINAAWEILGDPVRRARFDARLSPPLLMVSDVRAEVEVGPGEDAIVSFTVDNSGGPIPGGKQLTFSCSDKTLEFSLLRYDSKNQDTMFPLEVALAFRTSGLAPDVWHETTVEVLLEDK